MLDAHANLMALGSKAPLTVVYYVYSDPANWVAEPGVGVHFHSFVHQNHIGTKTARITNSTSTTPSMNITVPTQADGMDRDGRVCIWILGPGTHPSGVPGSYITGRNTADACVEITDDPIASQSQTPAPVEVNLSPTIT